MSDSLRHGAASDIGRRETNEDSFLAEPPLFAVADGMGGHRAGDVASRTALEVMAREIKGDGHSLREAVQAANREVHDRARSNPELSDMGTTLTAMLAEGPSIQIVHVGDSRAYLLREGALSQITQDHSMVGRFVREGRIHPEEAEHHPQRSILERALGVNPQVEVDLHKVEMRPGDRVILCSDGLTGILDEEDIVSILEDERDAQAASERLVAAAVEAGASDNVTAVVVQYPSDGPAITPSRRRRGSRRLIAAAVAAALLLLLAVGARAVLASNYYVGEDGGRVAIFRGVSGSVLGIRLNRVAERTDLTTDSLPETVTQDLRQGIKAQDHQDALEIVANLRSFQRPQETPTQQQPSPGPGGARAPSEWKVPA